MNNVEKDIVIDYTENNLSLEFLYRRYRCPKIEIVEILQRNNIKIKDYFILEREITSLTQDEVAKYLGITREKYAGIELGMFPPTLVMLKQLAKLFNVSVTELTGSNEKLNYDDFNVSQETKDKLDMIDLFYANKNLYKKLIYQKQTKGVK